MNKGTKRFGQVALAGAIAIGGLGVGATADVPLPGFKAEQADAALLSKNIWMYSYAKNSIDHQFYFTVDSNVSHTGRTANWYVKDGSANVKLRGTTSVTSGFSQSPGTTTWETAPITTSLTTLSPGPHELLYIYTSAGQEFRETVYFYKNADGTIQH